MQHLDDGLLMALLDRELTGSERQEVDAHLRACADCSARLKELQGVMMEADGLVKDLGEPPAVAERPAGEKGGRPAVRFSPRTLAWAASIVAALGLGYAGSNLLRSNGLDSNISLSDAERTSETPATMATPAPATAPPQMALQEERAQPGAGGAGAALGPADETERIAPDTTLPLSNDAQAVRSNAGEAGQVGAATREQDAADFAAVGRDTTPTVEPQAKVSLPRAREPVAERRLAAAPSSQSGFRQERAANPVFQQVTMEEAVRRLSGTILLLDGLTPEEFEVAASDSGTRLVRVIYRIGRAETRLFLEQRRVDNSFVASDLQASGRTEDQVMAPNRLSWNDLRGFALTLSGPFSADSLFHFKTLVK